MKQKLEILAKLLKEEKITIDEFVVLIQTEKEYIYSPTYIPSTLQPYYSVDPYKVTC